MRKYLNPLTLLFVIFSVAGLVFGQPGKPSVISAEVVSVADNKLTVSTKAGQMNVALSAATTYKRVSAEKPDLQAATPAALSDIGVGDKLLVTGFPSEDGKTIPARAVYLMTKSDIAQKQAKESEQWKTRGITGRVISVNAQANQIEVEQRSLMGSTKTTLIPKDKTKYLRYAEDSIRYDEAKSSSVGEIKTGDMLRALGDRSADGTTFTAEEVITGAFQTIAGTVKSVDAEKQEILIKNLQTGKDVNVVVGDASVMKRFPAEMAERMAGFQMGGGVRPVGQNGASPPSGTGGQASPSGRGPRGGNIDEMLERFPNITAADLKPGDMVAFSSTKGSNIDRIKAIKLLAGVEPFLRMAEAGNGSQRSQGVQGGFTIPGLDGVGF